jgi:hypothetical protein
MRLGVESPHEDRAACTWDPLEQRRRGLSRHRRERCHELLAFRDERRAAEPGSQLLFVLDDAGQAAYTSGHACDMHDLLNIDSETLPPNEYALYDKDARYTPERWASVMVPRHRALAADATLSFDQQLIPIDDADIDLVALYRDTAGVYRSPLDCLTITAAVGLRWLLLSYRGSS